MTNLLIAFAVLRGIFLRPITWAHLAWVSGGEKDTAWLIQRRINSTAAAGGGTISLPPGVFRIDSPGIVFPMSDGRVAVTLRGTSVTNNRWETS